MIDRSARVFGRLLLTTVHQATNAPRVDGANARDAEGRRYGAFVFGRGRRALVIGWRDAPVPPGMRSWRLLLRRWLARLLLALAAHLDPPRSTVVTAQGAAPAPRADWAAVAAGYGPHGRITVHAAPDTSAEDVARAVHRRLARDLRGRPR